MRPLSESVARAGCWVADRRTEAAGARALAALALRAHRRDGASARWLLHRLARLRRDGFQLHPYFAAELAMLGALDPAVPEEALLDHVPVTRLRPLQLRLSPPPLTAVIDDKALFYTVCELAGLPVPETHAFLYRDEPGWTRDGRTPRTRAEWASALERVLEGEIVVKPALGDRGEGLRGFRCEGARFYEDGRLVGGAGELHDAILTDRHFDGFVIQRRVANHESIAELSGGATLQSTRVATLVERPGEIAVLYAKLKFGSGDDGVADNTLLGATGNSFAVVDLETGRLGRLKLPHPEGGIVESDCHPATGRRCTGLRLPFWEETLELAQRAAERLGMLRTIGWDIAITPDGPLLLEGNAGWGSPNGALPVPPLLRRLEEAVRREQDRPLHRPPGRADAHELEQVGNAAAQ